MWSYHLLPVNVLLSRCKVNGFTITLVLQESRHEIRDNLHVITVWTASPYPPRASLGARILSPSTSKRRLRRALKSIDPNRTSRPVRVIAVRGRATAP